MWQRDGQNVEFRYTGNDQYYRGQVESSRVKYGGTVQHCVRLHEPVVIYGTKRTHLLVDEPEILVDN